MSFREEPLVRNSINVLSIIRLDKHRIKFHVGGSSCFLDPGSGYFFVCCFSLHLIYVELSSISKRLSHQRVFSFVKHLKHSTNSSTENSTFLKDEFFFSLYLTLYFILLYFDQKRTRRDVKRWNKNQEYFVFSFISTNIEYIRMRQERKRCEENMIIIYSKTWAFNYFLIFFLKQNDVDWVL